jgi:hypothetical protein
MTAFQAVDKGSIPLSRTGLQISKLNCKFFLYMNWIIIIIVIIIGWFTLSAFLQQMGIKKIQNKVFKVSKKINAIIQNKSDFTDLELYSLWLEKMNPEQLFIRIMGHSIGNKKLRGELCGKLWLACDAMDRVMELDKLLHSLIQLQAFSEIEEIQNDRENLIKLIEQCIGDIQKKIS